MLLVTPGIATSAGHDKVMALARATFGAEPPMPLARPETWGASAWGWRAIEVGKLALAQLGSERGPMAWIAQALEAGSVRARGSGGLSAALTAPYRAELEARDAAGESALLVSSHYLALCARPARWPALLLGPDLLAQSSVARIPAPRSALAPCRWYADGLLEAGFAPETIRRGLFVPEEISAAARARGRGRGGDEVFLTIGGSAPEAAAAVETARAWAKEGVRLTALVGDGRPHARRLRSLLETSGVEVHGGRPDDTRASELESFLKLLARPELGTWLTRPNEGAMLGLALGFEVVLLPPYQPHEKAAAARLRSLDIPEAGAVRPPRSSGSRPEMGPLISEEEARALVQDLMTQWVIS